MRHYAEILSAYADARESSPRAAAATPHAYARDAYLLLRCPLMPYYAPCHFETHITLMPRHFEPLFAPLFHARRQKIVFFHAWRHFRLRSAAARGDFLHFRRHDYFRRCRWQAAAEFSPFDAAMPF